MPVTQCNSSQSVCLSSLVLSLLPSPSVWVNTSLTTGDRIHCVVLYYSFNIKDIFQQVINQLCSIFFFDLCLFVFWYQYVTQEENSFWNQGQNRTQSFPNQIWPWGYRWGFNWRRLYWGWREGEKKSQMKSERSKRQTRKEHWRQTHREHRQLRESTDLRENEVQPLVNTRTRYNLPSFNEIQPSESDKINTHSLHSIHTLTNRKRIRCCRHVCLSVILLRLDE